MNYLNVACVDNSQSYHGGLFISCRVNKHSVLGPEIEPTMFKSIRACLSLLDTWA